MRNTNEIGNAAATISLLVFANSVGEKYIDAFEVISGYMQQWLNSDLSVEAWLWAEGVDVDDLKKTIGLDSFTDPLPEA